MAADIRIARKDAGKIGLPEVALGVLPGTGGAAAGAAGRQGRAIELMATGRLMSMDEAKTLGIVTEVWGDAELKADVPATPCSTTRGSSRRRTRRAARWAA